MRQIKFRAWNGTAMEYGGFSIHATGVMYSSSRLSKADADSPIMQYTGLKNKGVDIYEGDLRQWSFEGIDRIYEVYYNELLTGFRCKLVKYSDKYDPSIDEFEEDFHKRMIRENSCCHVICDRWSKAIGNIYTDKELLK